jgi:alkylation response protein AidB-like acyl-CoA dehydrogenase
MPVLSPADAEAFARPARKFMAEAIIPLGQKVFSGGDDALRIRLQRLARDAGLLAPPASAEHGADGAACAIRAFRVYDGPPEAHRMAIARRSMTGVAGDSL